MKIEFPSAQSENWLIINDDVMGGRTAAQAIEQDNSVLFKGNLSLENNGGFASYRSPWGKMDLSKSEGIEIRVRGDGRKYAFSLSTDQRWWRPNHRFSFKTVKDEWKTIKMPLASFNLVQVGEVVREGSPMNEFEEVIRIGFILSDKQAGEFAMEVDWIDFY